MLVLKVLALAPMHGLGISRRIRQITDGTFDVPMGSLFPALTRLEQDGWIEASWGESDNNRRAKYLPAHPSREGAAGHRAQELGASCCRHHQAPRDHLDAGHHHAAPIATDQHAPVALPQRHARPGPRSRDPGPSGDSNPGVDRRGSEPRARHAPGAARDWRRRTTEGTRKAASARRGARHNRPRRPVDRADARPQPSVRRRHHPHARPRHWRHHRRLQHRQRRSHPGRAVRGGRPAGGRREDHPRPQRPLGLEARLFRLPGDEPLVRATRRHYRLRPAADGGRRSRAVGREGRLRQLEPLPHAPCVPDHRAELSPGGRNGRGPAGRGAEPCDLAGPVRWLARGRRSLHRPRRRGVHHRRRHAGGLLIPQRRRPVARGRPVRAASTRFAIRTVTRSSAA